MLYAEKDSHLQILHEMVELFMHWVSKWGYDAMGAFALTWELQSMVIKNFPGFVQT